MKVLKAGTNKKGWAKELICSGEGNHDGGCGSLLLVEFADLYKTCSHSLDETDTYITFQCPSCGVETDIKNVPIPNQHQISAKNKRSVV
jgi:hypothetical protein